MFTDSKCFFIVPANGYLTIKLVGVCDPSNIKGFELEVLEQLGNDYPHLIINCEHAASLSTEWLRSLLKLQLTVKNYNKLMRLILVAPAMKQQLKKDGMDSAFKISASLREALVEFGLATKKMLDTDFINPFLTATLHVLKIQAGITAESEKPFLKGASDKLFGDVSGVIGIVSESFTGSVVISFPESTFLTIMSGMLGETYTQLSQEILDGAGEITNMIFGQAKITLNEKGYGIRTAIPSVVSGKEHSLTTLTKGPVVVIPFSGSAGKFFVEICLSE